MNATCQSFSHCCLLVYVKVSLLSFRDRAQLALFHELEAENYGDEHWNNKKECNTNSPKRMFRVIILLPSNLPRLK